MAEYDWLTLTQGAAATADYRYGGISIKKKFTFSFPIKHSYDSFSIDSGIFRETSICRMNYPTFSIKLGNPQRVIMAMHMFL